jgi:hypothetical protein
VGDAIGNHFDSEALGIADRFFPDLAVTHYARKLDDFRDPAAASSRSRSTVRFTASPAEYKRLNVSSAWQRTWFTRASVHHEARSSKILFMVRFVEILNCVLAMNRCRDESRHGYLRPRDIDETSTEVGS